MILGAMTNTAVAPRLLSGLKRSKHRGKDSVGIATVLIGQIYRHRSILGAEHLGEMIAEENLPGLTGIGHGRWATHGIADVDNAHPHCASGLGLVHNGIIECYLQLMQELQDGGYAIDTKSDSRVLAGLVSMYLGRYASPEEAARAAIERIKNEATYGIAMIFESDPDLMFVARKGCPVVLGYGEEGEMFVGSDPLTLSPYTDQIQHLKEGDVAYLRRGVAPDITNVFGKSYSRPIKTVPRGSAVICKEPYKHFMRMEMGQQPRILGDTLKQFIDQGTERIILPPLPFDLATVPRLAAVACGSASYASMMGQYWLEGLAGLPVDWDIASEFRYRNKPLVPGQGGLFTSQSGETIDTLEAMRHLQALGHKAACILNTLSSTMGEEADGIIPTLAETEIGVASTKAFTAQALTYLCLAIGAAAARGKITLEQENELVRTLLQLPSAVLEALEVGIQTRPIGQALKHKRDIFYLGRGINYATALEGALKNKEISYMRAEAYPAGELKHGPIALIDEEMYVVVVAPRDEHFLKTASNLQEVLAREAKVILYSDAKGIAEIGKGCWATVCMPTVDPLLAPIVYSVGLQFLAYDTADAKGTDIDNPKNLAKSVTVE